MKGSDIAVDSWVDILISGSKLGLIFRFIAWLLMTLAVKHMFMYTNG